MTDSAFIVAGPQTGVGKTSVTLGLIGLLSEVGQTVQPFKVGPDFIDPAFHRAAAGRDSYNLDSWMLDPATNRYIFNRHATEADVSIVEGVMGLYDGRDGASAEGSTAEIARILELPIILTVDIWSMGRSVAPLVHGFDQFADDLEIAGVILNRTAGDAHTEIARTAIEGELGVPVFGAIPKSDRLATDQKHLGLAGRGPDRPYLEQWRDAIARHIDHDSLLEATRVDPRQPAETSNPHQLQLETIQSQLSENRAPAPRLAVSRDDAFFFLYQQNLDLLRRFGVEIEFFSPLESAPSDDVDGVYLCGGYPESHARQLSQNRACIEKLRVLADQQVPIYAECGGLMYLARELTDSTDRAFQMVGLVPLSVRMSSKPRMDYCNAVIADNNPLFTQGTEIRGHLFHYSRTDNEPDEPAPFELETRYHGLLREGFSRGSVLASYAHLHLASNPRAAAQFVRRLSN